MAATTAGALKATIESLGLGLSAYRDGAPTRAVTTNGQTRLEVAVPYPHVVVQEGVGLTPVRHGDTDDPDGHRGLTELVQLDLLEHARDATGAKVESTTLAGDLLDALQACTRELQRHAPWRVYGCRVQSALRSGPTDNIVRTTITVAVDRDSRRTP